MLLLYAALDEDRDLESLKQVPSPADDLRPRACACACA
jgi:hypothetical protein